MSQHLPLVKEVLEEETQNACRSGVNQSISESRWEESRQNLIASEFTCWLLAQLLRFVSCSVCLQQPIVGTLLMQ